MKAVHIIGVLVFLLVMVGSASACDYNLGNGKYSLSLEKSANTSTYDHVGQVIEYTYVVTNTGENIIKGTIYITDDKMPRMKIIIEDDLAIGASVTRTATYMIKDTDLNNYKVTNTATASTTVNRQDIQDTASATIKNAALTNAALTITKSANTSTYDHVGQVIEYTYVVTNTGKVKINYPIKVTDDHIDNGYPFRISGRNGELAVGGKITYPRTYTVTQADFDAGSVTNTAYATGAYCGKEVRSNTDTETVTAKIPTPDTQIPEFPSIALPVASILGLAFISQYRRKEE